LLNEQYISKTMDDPAVTLVYIYTTSTSYCRDNYRFNFGSIWINRPRAQATFSILSSPRPLHRPTRSGRIGKKAIQTHSVNEGIHSNSDTLSRNSKFESDEKSGSSMPGGHSSLWMYSTICETASSQFMSRGELSGGTDEGGVEGAWEREGGGGDRFDMVVSKWCSSATNFLSGDQFFVWRSAALGDQCFCQILVIFYRYAWY